MALLGNAVASGRRRAAVAGGAGIAAIDGTLVDAGRDGSGHFFVLTRRTIAFALPNSGIFRTPVDDGGTPSAAALLFELQPEETIVGRAIVRGAGLWAPEVRFDPGAGADRVLIHDF
jgi:hypothetical protein